jgi:hypothetical protein
MASARARPFVAAPLVCARPSAAAPQVAVRARGCLFAVAPRLRAPPCLVVALRVYALPCHTPRAPTPRA